MLRRLDVSRTNRGAIPALGRHIIQSWAHSRDANRTSEKAVRELLEWAKTVEAGRAERLTSLAHALGCLGSSTSRAA